MVGRRSIRSVYCPAVIALAVVVLSTAGTASAGIIVPQPIAFDAQDLERSMSRDTAAKVPAASTNAPLSPARNGNQQPDPLALLKTTWPGDSSSSSNSSSTGGNGVGTGVTMCWCQVHVVLADDASLGQLPEDHGLSLPDPPGTDLLRPPRCS